jgi:hypothetical protein
MSNAAQKTVEFIAEAETYVPDVSKCPPSGGAIVQCQTLKDAAWALYSAETNADTQMPRALVVAQLAAAYAFAGACFVEEIFSSSHPAGEIDRALNIARQASQQMLSEADPIDKERLTTDDQYAAQSAKQVESIYRKAHIAHNAVMRARKLHNLTEEVRKQNDAATQQ